MSDGPDMKELEKKLAFIRPKFIYVMPNFQNPTGYTYSERKRRYLLLLCRKYDVLAVEDDYMSDLSYLDVGKMPLKGLDREDRVIYIKSFQNIHAGAESRIPDNTGKHKEKCYGNQAYNRHIYLRIDAKGTGSLLQTRHMEQASGVYEAGIRREIF